MFVRDEGETPRLCVAEPKKGRVDCPLAQAYPAPADPRGELLVVVQVDGPRQRLATWSGGEPQPLTAWAGAIREPRWSPDGATLSFASPHEGVSALWQVDREGGEPRLLDHHPRGNFEPNPGPDGRLVFGTSRDGNAEVYALGPGGVERITDHPGDDVSPALSPDGSRLAWLHSEDGVQRVWVRRDGLAGPLLPDVGEQEGFAWSPSGDLLAVTVLEAGVRSLRIVDPAGTEKARIAMPGGAQRAVWSGDGRFLAFETSDAEGVPQVAISHVSGRGPAIVAEGWLPRFVPVARIPG